jgi:hypothetical protein
MNQLRGGGFRVAPESGGAADTNGFWGFSHVPVPCLSPVYGYRFDACGNRGFVQHGIDNTKQALGL